jgi:hypothetical protein
MKPINLLISLCLCASVADHACSQFEGVVTSRNVSVDESDAKVEYVMLVHIEASVPPVKGCSLRS